MSSPELVPAKVLVENLDKRSASSAVWLETTDHQLLIIKSPYKQHWSIPGGIVDSGEEPIDTAMREVQEEVGISINLEPKDFRMVVSRRSDRYGMSHQYVFWAQIDQMGLSNIVLQREEVEAYALVTAEEVLAGERNYGTAVLAWANGSVGYAEHSLD